MNDTDGDGVADEVDSDNGGVALGNPDADNDGVPNASDLDNDNDGITDIIEAGGVDVDGDGQIDYPILGDPTSIIDTDDDGIADEVDVNNGGVELPNPDTDGDGVPNYLDVDSDNDGITDATENGGLDLDGDGELDDFVDTANSNGLSDSLDGTPIVLIDTDVATLLDVLPNYLDLDSDGDGITDTTEAGGIDADGDGQVDYVTAGDPSTMIDVDGNGLADAIDPSQGNTPLPVLNSDADSLENYIDIDSDGDGIIDNIEGQVSTLISGYRAPSGNDVDGDGIDDNYDSSGFGNIVPVDTDSDSVPDYIDENSDGDAEDDLLEGWDANNNGIIDGAELSPVNLDSDGDGLDNGFDNNSTNLNPTNGGQNASDFPDNDIPGGEPNWREALDIDWDNDGIDDVADLDDDNDGIPDIDESGGVNPNADVDGDGVPAYLDDNDNDAAIGNADGIEAGFDTDNDGVPNHLDLDSDNDGIYDIVESGQLDGITIADGNNDGVLDGSSFGTNGLLDDLEVTPDSGTLNSGTADSDTDGIPDSNELNSDDDGCSDVLEAGFTDVDGAGRLGNDTGLMVDINGVVTTGIDGYTTPLDGDSNNIFDFQEEGEAVALTTQPVGQTIIINANANFDITGTAAAFQWQESTDNGTTWNDIADGGTNPTYSGTTTDALMLTSVPATFGGNQYRVILSSPAFACDSNITSDEVILSLFIDNDSDNIPDVSDLDDDNDGILDVDEGCDEALDIVAEFGPLGTVIPLTANSFTVTDFSNSGIDFRFTEIEGSRAGFPLVTSNNQTAILIIKRLF